MDVVTFFPINAHETTCKYKDMLERVVKLRIRAGAKKRRDAVSHLAMVSGPPLPCMSSGQECPFALATRLLRHTKWPKR